MRRIGQHLGLATGVLISNVWLLETGGARLLFDSGHPVERLTLLASLWRAGVRRRGDLAGVVLTHRHSDHAGNAAWLKRRFGCPVFCHAGDAPFLTGQRAPRLLRPETAWPTRLLCRIEDRFPARCHVDEIFDEGPWRFGLRSFPVPGHTTGSALLYHEPSRTLFSGDSILAGPPVQRLFTRLHYASPNFSEDAQGSRRRVQEALSALPPVEALCSGHGPAVTRGAARLLEALRAKGRLAPL